MSTHGIVNTEESFLEKYAHVSFWRSVSQEK